MHFPPTTFSPVIPFACTRIVSLIMTKLAASSSPMEDDKSLAHPTLNYPYAATSDPLSCHLKSALPTHVAITQTTPTAAYHSLELLTFIINHHLSHCIELTEMAQFVQCLVHISSPPQSIDSLLLSQHQRSSLPPAPSPIHPLTSASDDPTQQQQQQSQQEQQQPTSLPTSELLHACLNASLHCLDYQELRCAAIRCLSACLQSRHPTLLSELSRCRALDRLIILLICNGNRYTLLQSTILEVFARLLDPQHMDAVLPMIDALCAQWSWWMKTIHYTTVFSELILHAHRAHSTTSAISSSSGAVASTIDPWVFTAEDEQQNHVDLTAVDEADDARFQMIFSSGSPSTTNNNSTTDDDFLDRLVHRRSQPAIHSTSLSSAPASSSPIVSISSLSRSRSRSPPPPLSPTGIKLSLSLTSLHASTHATHAVHTSECADPVRENPSSPVLASMPAPRVSPTLSFSPAPPSPPHLD